MTFLPDIDEEGNLKEPEKVPKLYTPPTTGRTTWDSNTQLHKDTAGTRRKDAPTMDDMHECIPDEEAQCIMCRRDMIV